ncbi:MAG: PepSY protein [Verrucomicrobiales bacterium]|nr:PepSY protein [Verrucomicrobiales bacterium]
MEFDRDELHANETLYQNNLIMSLITNWIKNHLVATGVAVFALAAAVPWGLAAVRVAKSGQPLSLEAITKDQRRNRDKDMSQKHADSKELRAVFVDAGGTTWIGTKGGLYSGREGKFSKVEGGPAMDVRGIALDGATGNVFAAGKDGTWLKTPSEPWKIIREGEAHGLSLQGSTLLVASKKSGVVTSADAGATWTPMPGTEMFAEMEHHD